MTEQEPDFFNRHSTHFLEMALSRERNDIIKDPDGYGKNTGECGDTVQFFLITGKSRITRVSYVADGCINTHACANTVGHMAEGKKIESVWDITPDDIIAFLETLPPESFHCAELAVGAFYRALRNLNEMRQSPWKRLYRKT
jgi:nitrogen fixation protein NifU and related proteins